MTPPAMAPPTELLVEDEASLSDVDPPVNSSAVTFVDQDKDSRDNDDREQDSREREDHGETTDETTTTRKGPTNVCVLVIAFVSFLVFVLVQVAFALMANSRSMLADSEAMMVDAATYLFNLIAERIKEKKKTREGNENSSANHTCEKCLEEEETGLEDHAGAGRDRQAHPSHNRHGDVGDTQNLYLELIPPALSVVALTVVTSLALRSAMGTLVPTEALPSDEPVNLTIMLSFSSANLLLDFVNVYCFSRIKRNLFGLENLNICSAWTHVLADTMRSIAVLLAAGIAKIFTTIPPAKADAVAAVVVSAIILVSVVRLVQGIIMTAMKACRSPPPSPVNPPDSHPTCATCTVRAGIAAGTVQDPRLNDEPANAIANSER